MDNEEEIFQILNRNGVTIDKVLPIFLGDKSYYIEIMKNFIKENEIVKLHECIRGNEYEAALNHGYNLKALTGTLGLSKAYQISQDLCVHIREKNLEAIHKEIGLIEHTYDCLKEIFADERYRES
ncbi:MAG: hypothetical protein PHE02_02925 [Lachnospiraceae bacterium]|nr:hypothetical protein [Lachnospiraceae bacterium]